MNFPTVAAAQEWSTQHEHHIYVEIDGAEGVLEVFPGGRKVFVAADKGKVYERWRKKLTPNSEFSPPVTPPGTPPGTPPVMPGMRKPIN